MYMHTHNIIRTRRNNDAVPLISVTLGQSVLAPPDDALRKSSFASPPIQSGSVFWTSRKNVGVLRSISGRHTTGAPHFEPRCAWARGCPFTPGHSVRPDLLQIRVRTGLIPHACQHGAGGEQHPGTYIYPAGGPVAPNSAAKPRIAEHLGSTVSPLPPRGKVVGCTMRGTSAA